MEPHQTHCIRSILLFICIGALIVTPVLAFTANSLDITVDKSGDATAVFRFTLDGLLENAIPQSMLEEQLVKGLGSSSEPPTLVSMDRSSATIVLKKFAVVGDVPTGTQYMTSTMDFKKAEIALQNSAVSSVVTADFSPSTVTLTFPDKYSRSFSNVDSLPSVTYIIVDPSKAAAASAAAATGTIRVSGSPAGTEVYIDETYVGNSPSAFPDIAPGTHTLRFQKDQYTPVTKKVNVTAGRTLPITVFLVPAASTTTAASPGFEAILAALAVAGCVLVRLRK
jgi:hypothetical protein